MDNDQPTVSVIIPVFNTARWLPECLESVLNQTLKDIEVICVDDCSTDPECRRIILDYQHKDSRIIPLFLEKNGKQGIARNRGFAIARGRYAYFLDSDDYILPETLEKAYDAAEKNALDVLFFDYDNIFDESLQNPVTVSRQRPENEEEYAGSVISGEKLLEEFLSHNAWICYVQKQFWRTEYLRENDVHFLYCEHEDEYFSLTGIMLAKRAMYIKDRLFIRRFRADSVMTKPVGPTNAHGYLVNVMQLIRFSRVHGVTSQAFQNNCRLLTRRFVACYNQLQDKEQLAGWFRDPDERDFYEWFLLVWQVGGASRCNECRLQKTLKPLLQIRRWAINIFKHVRNAVVRKQ